jgi:transposase-like protein
MLTCPHCGQQTTYPFAPEFSRVYTGRFICGHCAKEFFVLDNLTVTEEEFITNFKVLKAPAG